MDSQLKLRLQYCRSRSYLCIVCFLTMQTIICIYKAASSYGYGNVATHSPSRTQGFLCQGSFVHMLMLQRLGPAFLFFFHFFPSWKCILMCLQNRVNKLLLWSYVYPKSCLPSYQANTKMFLENVCMRKGRLTCGDAAF